MKKLLVIAYYFPPLQASGVFRTLAFVRHLSSLGWDITVLTLQPSDHTVAGDILMGELSMGVKVVRAKERDIFRLWARMKRDKKGHGLGVKQKPEDGGNAPGGSSPGILQHWKHQISAFVKTPDSQTGWFFPALVKGIRLQRPDIIYSSAPPFTGHVIGALLKKRWKVPLVIDYRDPWWGNPFRPSYGGWVEKWDNTLEAWTVQSADCIIANTDSMAEMLRDRFSHHAKKVITITNGFDPEEFKDLQSMREVPEERLYFVHPGVLYGKRNPLPFLRALRKTIREDMLDNILVHFIGRSEKFEGKSLEQHIEDMDLAEHVHLIPPMEHNKVLAVMKGADILLLLALGTTLQVPAKVFEYMGVGKPIFAVCEEQSATLQLMRQLGKNHYIALNNVAMIQQQLEQVYVRWRRNKLYVASGYSQGAKQFFRSHLAGVLNNSFQALLSTRNQT